MPHHPSKQSQKFDLSEAQKEFLMSLLPKRYSLAPLVDPPQHQDEWGGKDIVLPSGDTPHESLNRVIQQHNESCLVNQRLQSRTPKEKSKHAQIPTEQICEAKTVKVQQSDRRLSFNQRDSGPIAVDPPFKESRSGREIEKLVEADSQLRQCKEIKAKKRMKERDQQSNKHSASLQTFSQLTNVQKQTCLKLLSKLKAYKASWPFRVAVDPIAQGVPNYLEIIKEPMDLRTIEKKVNTNKYEHVAEFYADIQRIFLNSYKFNPKDTKYFRLTCDLEDYYQKLKKSVEANPGCLDKSEKLHNSEDPAIDDFQDHHYAAKASQANYDRHIPALRDKKKKYTRRERLLIVGKVRELNSKSLDEVIGLVQSYQRCGLEESDDNFTIDFEMLSDECLERITQYFKSHWHLSLEMGFNDR